MFIVGIDPGALGAIACLNISTMDISIADMPTYKSKSGKSVVNPMELLEILEPPSNEPGSILAVLEQQWPRQHDGKVQSFASGRGYGTLETALAAHQYPLHEVSPGQWKKHFKLSSDKGLSRRIATQRFPRQADLFKRVKDDGRAEAALIALYGKEKLM